MFYVYLIFIVISTALANRVDLVGGNRSVCSGVSVELQCTLAGDYLHWDTPGGFINFSREMAPEEMNQSSLYLGQFMVFNSSHLRSSLTLTIVTQTTTVSCSGTNTTSSTTIKIEGPSSAPNRPLTNLDRIRSLNKTFSLVTVVWDIPDTNTAYISSYEIIVNPPIFLQANGIIIRDSSSFQHRQLTLTLQHGQQYSIRVRANSCDDRVKGAVSSPLNIKVQVPPKVKRCTALPVYGYYTNKLTRIEVYWDPIPDLGEDITDGITASVQQYTISAVPFGLTAPEINLTLDASNYMVCTSTKCKADFQSASQLTALSYDVSIVAKNSLNDGYSEHQVCSNMTIGSHNDLLFVDIRSDFNNVVLISCRPLMRFIGKASCEATYSTFSDTYSEASHDVGGAQDVISVFLFVGSEPEANLSIAVATNGGKQDVMVEGYRTDNMSSKKSLILHHICPENHTYNNDNESLMEPVTTTVVTETVSNTPESTTCSNIPYVLAAGIFLICLPTGIIVGVIVMMIQLKKGKNETEEIMDPVYEYISSTEILLQRSYPTKPPPKLPNPRKQ